MCIYLSVCEYFLTLIAHLPSKVLLISVKEKIARKVPQKLNVFHTKLSNTVKNQGVLRVLRLMIGPEKSLYLESSPDNVLIFHDAPSKSPDIRRKWKFLCY